MILNTLRRWMNGLIRGFWGLLKTVLSGATELILAQLKDFVLVTVTKLAETDLTNSEKRNAAFKEVKAYSIANKIQAKDHIINLIIEICVASLKAKLK